MNYKYRYIYGDKEVLDESKAFIQIETGIYGKHDPSLTVAGDHYYGTKTGVTLMLWDDSNYFASSFFNEKNLISGRPFNDISNKEVEEGSYPIYLSYKAAKELKIHIGDKVYIKILKGEDLEDIDLDYERYAFTIVGIIRPYTSFTSYNQSQTSAYALVSQETFKSISNYLENKLFICLTDKKSESSFDFFESSKSDDIREIRKEFLSVKSCLFFSSIIIVIGIIVIMEISYITKRRASDLKVFQLLGLNKKE